jgi:hypothetical protein
MKQNIAGIELEDIVDKQTFGEKYNALAANVNTLAGVLQDLHEKHLAFMFTVVPFSKTHCSLLKRYVHIMDSYSSLTQKKQPDNPLLKRISLALDSYKVKRGSQDVSALESELQTMLAPIMSPINDDNPYVLKNKSYSLFRAAQYVLKQYDEVPKDSIDEDASDNLSALKLRVIYRLEQSAQIYQSLSDLVSIKENKIKQQEAMLEKVSELSRKLTVMGCYLKHGLDYASHREAMLDVVPQITP